MMIWRVARGNETRGGLYVQRVLTTFLRRSTLEIWFMSPEYWLQHEPTTILQRR